MNPADSVPGYPLRLAGTLDHPLSCGLWLLKWLLATPQYVIVAAFLDTGRTVWGADGPWQTEPRPVTATPPAGSPLPS